MASPSAASPVEESGISPASGGGVFIAPVFVQTPLFSHQFFKPRRIAEAANGLVRKIETSVSENVERCVELFLRLASQNPLLKQLASLTSEFNALSQMRRGNYKNLNSISNHNFAAVLPGDSVAGLAAANGVINFLNIYNTLLVARLVLTWFPNAPPFIVSPLSTICDPYLNVFRGLIPPLGGTLDLSPILAFLILNAFTSTASALPAELPPAGASPRNSQNKGFFDNITTSSHKKWMRRLQGNSSKNPGKFE